MRGRPGLPDSDSIRGHVYDKGSYETLGMGTARRILPLKAGAEGESLSAARVFVARDASTQVITPERIKEF